MDLVSFISTIVGFLLKCISNIEDFIYFLVDMPGLIGGVVSTFPPFVVAGITTIVVFIVTAFVFKIYRDVH